jgi:hypothetical protein
MKLHRITRRTLTVALATWYAVVAAGPPASAQSADSTEVVWRDPQVRYLLTDMTGGGRTELYRQYATVDRDPDSCEAIRLWDAGVRVINISEFERKWVTNRFGKDGLVFRVVHRGTNRTITGNEVLLTSDLVFQDATVRGALLDFTLGAPVPEGDARTQDVNTVEAIRRWRAGARVLNTSWFEVRGTGTERRACYRGTDRRAEAAHIRLNCDLAYPEVNVRYFLADMMLGGSRDFYQRTAESAHEMGCQEAVARFDAGVTVANLDQFERKIVGGKTLITRKGSNRRISGSEVKLSSD